MSDEKLFSQAELDDILKDRLAREKVKYADLSTRYEALVEEKSVVEKQVKDLEAQVQELPQLKRQQLLVEVANEVGVPKEFLARLVGATKEELLADAKTFMTNLGSLEKTKPIPKTPDGGGTAPKKGMDIIMERMSSTKVGDK